MASRHDSSLGDHVWNLDWFVWETPEDARLWRNGEPTPLTKEDWAAAAISSQFYEYVDIVIPVGRNNGFKELIRVKTPCTIRQLLTAIHDFFTAPIESVDWIKEYDDPWEYRDTAVKRLEVGHVARRVDLNGASAYCPFTSARRLAGERRDAFVDCQGHVRYEGVRRLYDDLYLLVLGS